MKWKLTKMGITSCKNIKLMCEDEFSLGFMLHSDLKNNFVSTETTQPVNVINLNTLGGLPNK